MRVLVSTIALLAGLAPAVALADPVAIRAGERGAGVRLVFDWPEAVGHSARLNGNQLIIHFAREADANVASLPGLLSGWVSSASRSGDGKQITLSLKRSVKVSSFANAGRVVVDIAPAAPQAAAAAKPAPAAPVPQARVRTGRHQGFDRAVIELGATAAMKQAGDKVTLTATTQRRLTPAQINQLKLPQVAGVSQSGAGDKLAVTLTLKPGVTVSDFNVRNGIGVDFRDAPAVAKPAAPPAPAPVAETKPPEPKPAEPVPAPVAEVAKPAALPEPEVAPPLVAEAHKPETPTAEEPKPVAEVHAEPAAPAPIAETVVPVAAPDAAPAAVAAPVTTPVETTALSATALPMLEMTVPANTPMSVFRRGNSLFVVVNEKDTPRELIPLIGGALATTDRVELLNAQGGRVIRINLAGLKVSPVVAASSTGWQITFPETAEVTTVALPVVEEPDYSTGARVLVKTAAAASPVFFADPVLGDTLVAVPLAKAATGLRQRYQFTEADLLPSLQGVVVKPWSDTLNVISTADGVALTSTGGLKLAEKLASEMEPAPEADTATKRPDSSLPSASLPVLFDFRSMGRPAGEKFVPDLMKLQDNIRNADPEKKDYARLELARFYFINGMATEANALWTLASQTTPDLSDLPDFKLIRAIAAFSSGSQETAKAALAAANQPTNDSALWQGALAAKSRDWVAAYDHFKSSTDRIWDYPEPYRSRLAIAAVETALNTQDYGQAEMLLSTLNGFYRTEKRDVTPAMEYLTGQLNWSNKQFDRARANLGSAAQSWNQYWRVRADLALIDADLKDAKIPVADIMRRVERMRFAWRGDALEFDILHRLAKLHIATAAYAAAFDDYAQMVEKFPNDPRTAGLEEEQKAAFTQIFQGDERDKSPAFSQLAVWERYPQFRPTQPAVLDSINTYMADRVAAIDLLSRAAEFHADVLKGTKDPLARSNLGVKMAALYTLDAKYDKALNALTDTEPAADQASVLSSAQQDERRMIKARALFGDGKAAEALDLLKDDYSDPATRLRADINWKSRKWPEAAAALDALIGPPPASGVALPEDKSALVLRRATALAIGGDRVGLADMRVKFGAIMAATKDANTFQLLTRPEVAGGLPDRATLSGRVAEVDLFQKFLERYRSSAQPEPEATEAVAGATP